MRLIPKKIYLLNHWNMDCKYYYDEFLKNKKENENNFEKKEYS